MRAAAGLPESLARTVAARRDRWVDDVADRVVRRRGARGAAFAESFGRLSRHPVWGLPILAAFLALTYFAVVHLAGWLASGLGALLTDPAVRLLSRVLPAGFWTDLLIGDYGLLTLGLFNAIITVLPILSVFFLLFALVEDSGYLPNITVLSRRLFAKVGLTGSSIIPLVLGFGCKTMATLTARNLRSRKERLIVVFLIAFAIPCSAQLGLNMAILGMFGPLAFAVAIAFLALVEVLAGVVLNLLLPGDEAGEYLQELPPIRVPSLRGVAAKTGHRLLSFLREALPVFLVAAVAALRRGPRGPARRAEDGAPARHHGLARPARRHGGRPDPQHGPARGGRGPAPAHGGIGARSTRPRRSWRCPSPRCSCPASRTSSRCSGCSAGRPGSPRPSRSTSRRSRWRGC